MHYENGSVADIGLKALEAAYKRQLKLSNAGTIGLRVSKGAGGDTSLRGDIESETEAIRVLKENNFPCLVYAEEHSAWEPIRIGDRNPEYLVVIDGFDGSSALAKNPRARGGTMLAIANTLNPKYSDFIFGGITDFSTNQIVYGLKRNGSFLRTYKGDSFDSKQLQKLPERHFNSETKVHLDDPKYWGEIQEGVTSGIDDIARVTREHFTTKLERYLEKENVSGLNSSGAMCLDLILGKVDAIGGVSAKGVFEQPTEYPIIACSGGVIVDYSGKDIGNNYWIKDREKHRENPVPSLRASSPQLAREILNYLH